MMKKINISLSKFKKIIKSIPQILVKKVKLLFICLILLDLLFGLLIFYQYNVLPPKKELKTENKTTVLKEKELAEVLNYIEQRKQHLQQVSSKTCPDLFNIR